MPHGFKKRVDNGRRLEFRRGDGARAIAKKMMEGDWRVIIKEGFSNNVLGTEPSKTQAKNRLMSAMSNMDEPDDANFSFGGTKDERDPLGVDDDLLDDIGF